MPTGLIRIVRNYSLIALVLGTLSASAADVGQSVTDDQSPPERSRPTRFTLPTAVQCRRTRPEHPDGRASRDADARAASVGQS